MTVSKFALALAAGVIATTAQATMPMLYEEALARSEEERIINAPIAGIENKHWFNYRIDIAEAQKELRSDLGKADDVDDLRDAWEEYAEELQEERKHYVEEMAERGYRMGTVTVVE
ncbi:hypothetical protein [Alterisphingorhabdus coralli]|uniref:DUF4148 domain-containing protein n=1 Tax=Alterisphingorhabdus coralli TaxID=3071408 RepID=A0AA97I0A1_9SPHN|nr:hypothetical protein [Parasphingorhabdus sp. SCSIO 66989]WOE74687.1 hypothetical protein RB602_12650 [Parasphingorhabdus sp. SCSIO 66989]